MYTKYVYIYIYIYMYIYICIYIYMYLYIYMYVDTRMSYMHMYIYHTSFIASNDDATVVECAGSDGINWGSLLRVLPVNEH